MSFLQPVHSFIPFCAGIGLEIRSLSSRQMIGFQLKAIILSTALK